MSNYFFYGTLREPEIAREILGRPLSGTSPRPCVLKGFKRVYVAGASYPALIADADCETDGILVKRISPIEASRLSRYEGPGYDVQEMKVCLKDGLEEEALVFVPKPAMKLSTKVWELDVWRRLEKKRFMAGLKRNILI